MRSRIDFIADRIDLNLAESGTEILLIWNEYADASVDPVTQARTGTPTRREECVGALLHFITASSTVRQFAEIQTGDALLDISPRVCLKGRADLRFLIAGEEYSAKPISEQLTAYWDVVAGGRKLFQTVLVRKGA